MGADGEGQAPRILMFHFSELNPDMRRDPHALLDPQRASAPAERDPLIHAVMITSYGLGRDLLTDPTYSRNFDLANPANPVIAGVKRLNDAVEAEFGRHATMLTMEDPDHARVRGIVAKAFLARAALARPLIERVVERTLAQLDGRKTFDIVEDYACRIPIHVLGPILGCDEAALDDLRRWTEAGQSAFDPTKSSEESDAAVEGRRGILRYFQKLIAERRETPGDDLVTDLIRAQVEGQPIDDGEILHNMFALLVAGHLTTADLIGNGVALLLTHPEARKQIEADPALIAPAVDEVLRYEPPIATTARFVSEPGAIGKCPYNGGDALAVSLLGANRDPDAFENPHTFDIARRPNPHLAFGAGAHMCVGAPLARAEGQEAILRLFARFPNLRRVEEGPLDWRAVAGVRGLTRLEVAVK